MGRVTGMILKAPVAWSWRIGHFLTTTLVACMEEEHDIERGRVHDYPPD